MAERQRIDGCEIEHWSGGLQKVAQDVERPRVGASHPIIEAKGGPRNFDDTLNYKVPVGHILVRRDNRDNSIDSRNLKRIGYVPMENLVGRPGMIYVSITESASASDGSSFLQGDRMFKMVN